MIRSAHQEEADVLTKLATEAKASWGYPEAWLREWEPALTFTPRYLKDHTVFVAEADGTVVGVAACLPVLRVSFDAFTDSPEAA